MTAAETPNKGARTSGSRAFFHVSPGATPPRPATRRATEIRKADTHIYNMYPDEDTTAGNI